MYGVFIFDRESDQINSYRIYFLHALSARLGWRLDAGVDGEGCVAGCVGCCVQAGLGAPVYRGLLRWGSVIVSGTSSSALRAGSSIEGGGHKHKTPLRSPMPAAGNLSTRVYIPLPQITFYSESQGLLQAAAGSGFIGFSAFQTPATPSFGGAGGGAAGPSPAGVKASAGTGNGGQRRVKTAKADRGRSSGYTGQVCLMIVVLGGAGGGLSDQGRGRCRAK